MKSLILDGVTRHCRFVPRRHAFQYRMMWLCIDLDELPLLNRGLPLLRHNRRAALFTLRNADYGGPGPGGIREKVESLLKRDGVSEPIGRITLITLPRVLGYAFNPVSFYRCYHHDGRLAVLVAEVRNTVGEAHHYVLHPEYDAGAAGGLEKPIRFSCPKAFYVSPFLQVRGDYELRLSERDDALTLEIDLRVGQERIFTADLSGVGVPLGTRSLLASVVRLPWVVGSVMSRITWQAVRLYLQRKLPVYAQPVPATSTATYRSTSAGFVPRVRAGVIRLASRRSSGRLAESFTSAQKGNA